MTDKIKIDIVSDIVCPWCAVGYKRLEQALKELGFEDKVTIEWKPFELNPTMVSEGENVKEHLIKKYRLSTKQAQDFEDSIVKNGKELGFKFDYFEDMRIFNTFDAHVLLDFAKEFDKQKELKIRLMEAYFSERKDISNREVLLQEVEKVGLNINKASQILDDKEVREQIQVEEKQILARGINSVPTMIFNGGQAMNGAYPVETYKQVLSELVNKQI